MAKLSLKNVFVNYFGARDSLHAFSHTFCTGLNVVYAEEGGGKTTLLKTIAGLVNINSGEITFNGEDYSKVKLKDKGIAMLFDDFALRPRRSVEFNLGLPLRLRKFAPEVVKERIAATLTEFGLSPNILNAAVFRLSEEYKARIALARVFIRESEIILIDNPFSRLAPDVREELFFLLLARARRSNAIVIYATDSSREAEQTVAKTAVLSFGYLTDCGYPDEFRRAPGTVLTAEKFIKFSSSYNIELDESGGFSLLKERFVLSERQFFNLIGDNYLGKTLIAVVPLDAVRQGGKMRGTVQNLIGATEGRIAIIEVNGETINMRFNEPISIGDIINIDIDADKIFLFDAANEKAVLKYENPIDA